MSKPSQLKVVINKCYGGFGLSYKALLWLHERNAECIEVIPIEEYYRGEENKNSIAEAVIEMESYMKTSKTNSWRPPLTPDLKKVIMFKDRYGNDSRTDLNLVECVETLKEEANGACAQLKVVEIPLNIIFQIEQFDGIEHVAQQHPTWS